MSEDPRDGELREGLRSLVEPGPAKRPDPSMVENVLARGRRRRRRQRAGAVAAVAVAVGLVGGGAVAVQAQLTGGQQRAMPAASLHPTPRTIGGISGWTSTRHRAPGGATGVLPPSTTRTRRAPPGGPDDGGLLPALNGAHPPTTGSHPSAGSLSMWDSSLLKFAVHAPTRVRPGSRVTPVVGRTLQGGGAMMRVNLLGAHGGGSLVMLMAHFAGPPEHAADEMLGHLDAQRHVAPDGTVLQLYQPVRVRGRDQRSGGITRTLDVFRTDSTVVRITQQPPAVAQLEGPVRYTVPPHGRRTDRLVGETLPLTVAQLVALGNQAKHARF